MIDTPPNEAETVVRIRSKCRLAGTSADAVARLKAKSGAMNETDQYELARYQRLRDEAIQLSESLTEGFYRAAASHCLIRLFMKAGATKEAKALYDNIDDRFIRERVSQQHPQLSSRRRSGLV